MLVELVEGQDRITRWTVRGEEETGVALTGVVSEPENWFPSVGEGQVAPPPQHRTDW